MEPEAAQTEEAVRQAQATANRSFPVPPFYYKAFTDSAWRAHKSSRSDHKRETARAGPSKLSTEDTAAAEDDASRSASSWNPFASGDREDFLGQTEIIFEPPRVDWMIEAGSWESFGQLNPVRS
jgi:hypothetical protein